MLQYTLMYSLLSHEDPPLERVTELNSSSVCLLSLFGMNAFICHVQRGTVAVSRTQSLKLPHCGEMKGLSSLGFLLCILDSLLNLAIWGN